MDQRTLKLMPEGALKITKDKASTLIAKTTLKLDLDRGIQQFLPGLILPCVISIQTAHITCQPARRDLPRFKPAIDPTGDEGRLNRCAEALEDKVLAPLSVQAFPA